MDLSRQSWVTVTTLVPHPSDFTDPSGTKIKICSRAGWQNLGLPGGVSNHAFFYDTRNGQNCDRGDQSEKENPSLPGTGCVDVPSSDGREDDVMACCRKTRNQGIWFPGVNDCHNSIERCLQQSNLPLIDAPAGRTRVRCLSRGCEPGPWPIISNPLLPYPLL